jgi:hypothetical protein
MIWRRGLGLYWPIIAVAREKANVPPLHDCLDFNLLLHRAITMKSWLKSNWCQLLVLVAVIWAVVFFALAGNEVFCSDRRGGFGLCRDFAPILSVWFGPLVIALAIFFLFPKKK